MTIPDSLARVRASSIPALKDPTGAETPVHLGGRKVSAASAACVHEISAYSQRYVSFARSNDKNTPEYSPGRHLTPAEAGLNVNRLLAAGLGGTFGWTADPPSPRC